MSTAPSRPVNHTQRRTTFTRLANRLRSPDLKARDRSRTELVPMPSRVRAEIMSTVLLYNPMMPTPSAPSQMATSLVLIIEQRMVNTCVPPKRPVAFTMVRYIFLSSPLFIYGYKIIS